MSNFSLPDESSDLYHIVSISLQHVGGTRHLDGGGISVWIRSKCKSGQLWPLMTSHNHSQPFAPTACNMSVFMGDDNGLSHLPVNTFQHTGIAFKLYFYSLLPVSKLPPSNCYLFPCLQTTTKLLVLFMRILTQELLLFIKPLPQLFGMLSPPFFE